MHHQRILAKNAVWRQSTLLLQIGALRFVASILRVSCWRFGKHVAMSSLVPSPTCPKRLLPQTQTSPPGEHVRRDLSCSRRHRSLAHSPSMQYDASQQRPQRNRSARKTKLEKMPDPNTCGNIKSSLLEDSLRNPAVFCTCLGFKVLLPRRVEVVLPVADFYPVLAASHQQGGGMPRDVSQLAHIISSPRHHLTCT